VRFKPDGAIAVVRARDELDAYKLIAETRPPAGLPCRIEPLPHNGPRAVLLAGLDFGCQPPSREMPERPPLRLLPTAVEAERFMQAYTNAEEAGDYDLRTSLGDQLFVRQQLIEVADRITDHRLLGFESRADRLIELAFHSGIAMALAYADRPFRDIEDALAREQEFTA
jgi:hypothetical protein